MPWLNAQFIQMILQVLTLLFVIGAFFRLLPKVVRLHMLIPSDAIDLLAKVVIFTLITYSIFVLRRAGAWLAMLEVIPPHIMAIINNHFPYLVTASLFVLALVIHELVSLYVEEVYKRSVSELSLKATEEELQRQASEEILPDV